MSHVPGLRRIPLALAVLVALAAAVAGALAGAPHGAATARAQAPPSAAYLDASLPVDQRVADLLGRMSLQEKVGQMTQINVTRMQGDPNNDFDRGPLQPDLEKKVLQDNLAGSILSGGGASPEVNTPQAWAEMTNELQQFAIEHSPHHIPIVYGVDAVHGHNNVLGATLFPHQVGLGSSFDAALAEQLGGRTARAVRATGIQWDFAPVVDTERDIRWGRSYEPFGEDPLLTGTMGSAVIRGLQGDDLSSPDHVAATAKHFTGYSAPDSGHDRTDATISAQDLGDIHLPPFADALGAGAQTVMVNSGSVNGVPVHASHALLTDVLRGKLGFKGVVVSDWQDIENLQTKYHVAGTYEQAVAIGINAGIDMSMVPLDETRFTNAMLTDVANGSISIDRVNEAVARVLALKFRLGLFEHPLVDASQANRIVEDPADKPLARKAAQESIVLLENRRQTLPLSPRRTRRVLVTGPSADSAVNQLGGWSIGWQGANVPGEVPDVTTVKEGVQQAAGPRVDVQFAPAGDAAVAAARSADAVVVAVGEGPYAEGAGDTDTAALPADQAQLVDALAATGKPVIVVVIAGRPLMMNRQLDEASAALMAWLPGTEGGAAVGDLLFGKVSPSARLSVTWPKSIAQVPVAYNGPAGKPYDPRYPFGYGLSYTDARVTDVGAPRRVTPGGTVPLRVDLRNDARRSGDEVVLAFAQRVGGAPARRLVAFTRTHLRGDERSRIGLSFPVSRLAVTGADGTRAVAPGTYRVTVGERSETFTVG
jgi:beta-glucosidase